MVEAGIINTEIEFPELKLDKAYAASCPVGNMPFIMQPRNERQIVVFTWSHWNPFPPKSLYNRHLPKIADKCVGKGRSMALVRLFGYTSQTNKCKIPNFRSEYYPKGHLLKHEDVLQWLSARPHTDYMADDGATARSHALLWKAVFPPEFDERSTQVICCEKPGPNDGDWVSHDESPGDGQKIYASYAVDDYKRLILETETEMKLNVIRRKADPRGFATEQIHNDGGYTYFELFARDNSGSDPLLGPMFFEPAKVRHTITEDLLDAGKLVDLLACDWDKEITAVNRPHLLISDQCTNTIHCWLNWDGTLKSPGGVANPYKDFVDVSRYLCDEETPFLDPAEARVKGGGGW